MSTKSKTTLLATLGAALTPLAAKAQEAAAAAPTFDTGDTAWMLVSTLLVLMMTIPGLALFYGGMVRKENVLSVLMQSFAITCVVSILWLVAGYSLVFTEGSSFVGSLDKFMLKGVEFTSASGTIPETVFIMFQLTFAVITPALIFGAVVDRMRFGPMILFASLWSLIVYAPVAHWVWGPGGFVGGTGMTDYAGFLGMGTMIDFAGGAVVHINAGIAGLVAALVLGKRKGYGTTHFVPHNLVLSIIGASLLWVGWFGFNAGSAAASGARAGMAMLVTQSATAAAAIAWVALEWILRKKPSVLGAVSGAVAGLVAITPASGFVGFCGSLIIGFSAGAICYFASTTLKNKLGYDDSLDVFGIHGVGGLVGSILTGVFAMTSIGGVAGTLEGNTTILTSQIVGSLVVVVYSAAVTFVLLKVINIFTKLRVDDETEYNGLDLALHGEKVQ